VTLRKAVELWGLHPNTLREYADEGKIKSIKNEAGQRLYDVQSYVNGAARASLVCYCRVSSIKQRDDLERQVSFMRGFYPEAEIIQNIGVGLNSQEKDLEPYWTDYCGEINSQLLCPHWTDYADLDSSLYSTWSNKTVAKSWFSTKLFTVPNQNLQQTCYKYFTSSLAECPDSGSTLKKSKKVRIIQQQNRRN